MISITDQFFKNTGVLNKQDIDKINSLNVLVVGLGGLGGHIANGLVRLGVKNLILVDYDKFQLSNLNRQIFSNHENIGHFKTEVTNLELSKINPLINITILNDRIQNIKIDMDTVDIIIDAVDNVETKLYLEKISMKLNTPLLHGACGGWYGQVSIIKTDKSILDKLYSLEQGGLEKELMNPYFAPSVVASYMLSEFTKWIKVDKYIYNHLLLIDVYNNSLEDIDLGGDNNG